MESLNALEIDNPYLDEFEESYLDSSELEFEGESS